ncbi:RNA recognition motif domain-containing protein [Thaumasiovibrio sp. DFM-14]|uniref:RNA recognition motif domain-containing protein n=1 Tax=Thaumasiovibrio sp. DFM-14 TaxID=3384792 RepID=UPI0039A3E8FA
MKSSYLITSALTAVIGAALLFFSGLALSGWLAFSLGAIASGLFISFNNKTIPKVVPPLENDSNASSRTLYVGNLPYRANESDVKALFEQHGEVYAVRLMKDKRTGKRRGFGFVVVSNASADHTIQTLNESDFEGRKLKVREANEPKHQEE